MLGGAAEGIIIRFMPPDNINCLSNIRTPVFLSVKVQLVQSKSVAWLSWFVYGYETVTCIVDTFFLFFYFFSRRCTVTSHVQLLIEL